MGNEKIDIIKTELSRVIGDIGRFIVEKQVKLTGHTEEQFPDEMIPDLIDKVVEIGVYDKQLSKSIKARLREKIGLE